MLAQAAREIFQKTLRRTDAGDAVRRVIRFDGSQINIRDFQVDVNDLSIYTVAVGKAAYPMAVGLNEVLGNFIKGGVISGVVPGPDKNDLPVFDSKWRIFEGGHPLPNDESLAAAQASLDLLKIADAERALIIFLISGGGSAMMEMARDPEIDLSELQALNRILVTSGASIMEINAVRRAVSLVKGGGLALAAPGAKQVSLIISDTSAGDITSVASGPSLLPSNVIPHPFKVIEQYNLARQLPPKIRRVLESADLFENGSERNFKSPAFVLLDNRLMTECAAEIADNMGFTVKIDEAANDSLIVEGCAQLFSRFSDFRRTAGENRPVCFISGGEFGCPVNGNGIGGRNSETVLRLLRLARENALTGEYAVLSAGTDGIDGNSPAAGAVADETLFERADSRRMKVDEYLENSDSFTFFDLLGDSIMTGPTGTNVRDLRLLMAG